MTWRSAAVTFVAVGATASHMLMGCDDGPTPEPVPVITADPVASVDPLIGTGGGGFGQPQTFVGATHPLAMARPGPDTSGALPRDVSGFAHTSGYWYLDRFVDGFSQMHFSGTGIEDYGNFLLMPTRGSVEGRFYEDGYRQSFSHANEDVAAGYYATTLDDHDIRAELTADVHSAFHRYTYALSEDTLPPTLVIDIGHGLGRHGALEAEIDVRESLDDDGRLVVEGMMLSAGRFTGENGAFNLYYSMTVTSDADSRAVEVTTFVDEEASSGRVATGTDVGASLTFPIATTALEVRVGVSFIDLEQARAHRGEVDGNTFEETRGACEDAWRSRLSVVELDEDAPEVLRTMFYTGLYHATLMPTLMSEYTGSEVGRYIGLDRELHSDDGVRAYSDLSMWDTYRTVAPLFSWLYPEDSAAVATSLTRMADEHGYLPRWPLAVNETGTMVGAPATIILADTALRGVEDFDLDRARQAMVDDANFEPGKTIRGNSFRCFEVGHCPADEIGRAVADAIEYGWADYALANFLRKHPGDDGDAAASLAFATELADRSTTWRAHFDADTGFVRGRNLDGSFTHPNDFDPITQLDDYAEGNAWQYTFGAFFDAAGFVTAFGSREAALAKLTALFENSEPLGPDYVVEEFRAADPYYWHSNEPDIHAAFLFSLLGAPAQAARWVKWVHETKHDDTPYGIDGNDDAGTLSAWYVWSVLGLYPISGSSLWVLSSPVASYQVRRAGLALDVQREGDGDFIVDVKVDGVSHARPWIEHEKLAAASTLTFEMGQTPGSWGEGQVLGD